jgi:hypothetical protein
MILHNGSRFVPTVFQKRDLAGADHWVFVLKGTFLIGEDEALHAAPDQAPILDADAYRGDPATSSLRVESDVTPLKPRSDVQIDAVARSPDGAPARAWIVRARVGAIDKRLRVTGPRRWERGRLGYTLTDPEPCTEVPIVYERAFGGVFRAGDRVEALEENPVGVGFVPADAQPSEAILPAPQIEDPDDPIGTLGAAHTPQGLGPIARGWQPRYARCGTLDEAWRAERWPALPVDFDAAFYNGAHPDLVYPGYLRGDEEVVLEGVDPRPLRFTLPAVRVALFAGPRREIPDPLLDTLFIDVPARRVIITWKAMFPVDGDLHVLGVWAGRPREETHG